MAEETSTINPSNEENTIEIAANPAFIAWNYPPYCELCNVYFSGEPCSKTHFESKNHTNRLRTWKKYQNQENSSTNSKTYLCNICWKEMNTKLILNSHQNSPAHLKEAKGRLIVQKLKEEYRQLKELDRAK